MVGTRWRIWCRNSAAPLFQKEGASVIVNFVPTAPPVTSDETRRKSLDLFGVKIVKFKSQIESGSLTLRFCRLRDLRSLYSLVTPEIFPTIGSNSKPHSLFAFYRWMKSTFRMIYLIEIEENSGRRIIGFAGLYDMELGRGLRLSLAIFNHEDRGRGYGEKALRLLLRLLQKNGAAEVVYVEILKSNVPSLRLCRKLGFRVNKLCQDRFLLEKNENIKSEEG